MQLQLIHELRENIRSGKNPHIRLIGEPGVGKTRMALELTRGDELAPATLYIREARTFLRSSFVNELIQADDHRFVVLVVDECPNKDRADIWNIVKSRCDRLRLITIDHGPDLSSDEMVRVENVKPIGNDEVVAILKDKGIDDHDASRWAKYCEGCPRVAHVFGENLRRTGCDLPGEPAAVMLWDRFVCGYGDRDPVSVEQRRIVLRYLSLFKRFGFESPVEDEAMFVARLAEQCDASLTWPRFQEIVCELKNERILQGATTLYITPRLLHVHLYRQFWQLHGRGFDIAQILVTMPASMRRWFLQMLRYTSESGPAVNAIDKLLESRELFPGGGILDDDSRGRVIDSLAEARPLATIRRLQRVIEPMTGKDFRHLGDAGYWVVLALEKLAVWEVHFVNAVELLARIAEHDEDINGRDVTEKLTNLFSLIPGLASTQAKPAVRLGVLRSMLNSSSGQQRQLGLEGCASALSTFGGCRMVGVEHQGLQRTIEFWVPQTYGELWDAYQEAWRLLVGKLETWVGDERRCLISTLV
ncbi:MAG: ATP-binding protein, partial [Proteobacteria bacterium]|nr:ATP-binding protein [Pseudomonadota bacterium]